MNPAMLVLNALLKFAGTPQGAMLLETLATLAEEDVIALAKMGSEKLQGLLHPVAKLPSFKLSAAQGVKLAALTPAQIDKLLGVAPEGAMP